MLKVGADHMETLISLINVSARVIFRIQARKMRVDMILPVAERIRKSVLSIEYEEVYPSKIFFEI